MELLISICAAILCVEAYAWLPRFSDWLIACAVARLPLSDRPRYAEEWKADLEAYLNSIVRVGHALTLVMSRAPEIIAEDNFEADMGEIDSLLASLAARFATALECRRKLGIAISRNSDVCRKFALSLQDPMEFETTSPIRLNEEL